MQLWRWNRQLRSCQTPLFGDDFINDAQYDRGNLRNAGKLCEDRSIQSLNIGKDRIQVGNILIVQTLVVHDHIFDEAGHLLT